MAGEGGQMSTGAGGTPASQQQPPTLLPSPAGSAALPGLMSSSGASGVSQTPSQLQQQKNQQAQRVSMYTQGAPIQAAQQQHLPGMAATPPGGTQLSRSLSGQRLAHLQQPGMTMVQRPTAAGGVGTTHYNQQYLSTNVAATSPGATTTPTMMFTQPRVGQGQQQRPNAVAPVSQARPGSYTMPQTQQYTAGQYVHHMGSVPMNAVRPGVQGTLLSGAGTQQYSNQQYLTQQTLQARQKQNQGQSPATHFQGTATSGQQQMTMARQGGALPSQPSQQQQQALQQQQQQQPQQQRLAQPQQQPLARQPQTQQGLPSPGNNMLSRVPSTGSQMQGLATGSQQQQLWQGKPSQFQQQQQQGTQRPQTAASTLAIDRARPGTPGTSQPNAAPSSAAGSANAEPGDTNGHLLGKRSIQDLLAQVDSRERLDPDVEDVLLEIADDFIESVTSFACQLAKHRKSNVLEAKDVLLHLDKQWNITVPGFGGEEYRSYKRPAVAETHRQRLALVRKSLAAAQPAAGLAPAPATNVSTPVRGGLSNMASGTLASPTSSPGLPRIPRV